MNRIVLIGNMCKFVVIVEYKFFFILIFEYVILYFGCFGFLLVDLIFDV